MQPQRATNEQIITAYHETGSIWRTGERLGITGGSVWERLRRLGISCIQKEWSADELAVASQLAGEAIPISQIAVRLGRTYAGVAAKLSKSAIAHPSTRARKIKRGAGLTKPVVVALAKYLLRTGTTVSKAAKQHRLSTTGLVNALQIQAPELWAEYVRLYAVLPDVQCPGCGNNFTPLNVRQKYCTNRCGGHARSDVAYFGGRRRTAIGLAEGVCQLCNKRKSGLAAHHVLGKQNDPENQVLIALCAGCHQLVGILGRRTDAAIPEFWENLITLAVARAWADTGRDTVAMHATVDIEELSETEIDELDHPARAEISVVKGE